MNGIADIRDMALFKQAVEAIAKDRGALKSLKGILMDRKTEIELKIDSPFYRMNDEKRLAMEGARGHIIRRMNHVDSILSKNKVSEIGGYLMWVVERVEGAIKSEGWLASAQHPVIWLVESLGEEQNPDDIELSHFFPLNQDQWDKLTIEIERV